MRPKGKKVKLNMKDFLSKHGLSEEKPVQGTPAPLRSHPEQEQEDTKSQNSQFNRKPEEKVTKKQQQKQAKKQLPQQDKQKQQDSRKGNSKKQGSIKSMIKQVMNQIVQQRHRHTLPLELINQVSKEQPSIRLIQLFQRMHLYYFKVFDIFKKNGHHQMQQLMERFSGKILSAVRELKQSRRSEIHSIKSVTNEQYSEKVMKYYSMELKLKDDQIKRKRNFRENARGKFTPQIKQIQDFINANSRLVTEAILKQQFQAVIDQVVTSNVQVVARKEKEGKEDMKSLFSEWRKMKKEKIMMERTYRADKIRRGEQWRAAMASKFPNMMGVLINPFNIYAEVK